MPLIEIEAHLPTLQLVLPAPFQFDQIGYGGGSADGLQDRHLIIARITALERDISSMARCEILAPAAKKALSAGRHTDKLFPRSRAPFAMESCVMRHDPASAAVVVMLKALKMYGMAQAVGDRVEQSAPAFDAAVPIHSQLPKAEMA